MNKLRVSVAGNGTSATALLRRISTQAVLDALVGSGEMTATDLIHATGLSRPTIHGVCDDLIAAGWARELAVAAGRPGRPARTYSLNGAAAHVVGVDLGALKTAAVVTDLRGKVVGERVEHLRDMHVRAPERIAAVGRVVAGALADAGVAPENVRAAVMGVSAPVTAGGHVVTVPSYLPGLADVDLRGILQPWLPVALVVENDANLAVLGERWRGVAAGASDVVMLLAGERLGAGIFLGDRLVRGAGGAAGELRFLELVEGVGNTDAIGGMVRARGAAAAAVEESASGLAAADDATPTTGGRAAPRAGSLLDRCAGRPETLTAEHVFAAARAGDRIAGEVLDVVTERVARVLSVLATLLDPEVMVIGGAVAEAGDVLLPRLASHLDGLMTAMPAVAASTLGDHAVLTGAVRLALDHALDGLLDDA